MWLWFGNSCVQFSMLFWISWGQESDFFPSKNSGKDVFKKINE